MKLLVTLEKGEDGYIVAECPAIPGCISQGITRDEALANIKEAIELCLEAREELGLPEVTEIDLVETAQRFARYVMDYTSTHELDFARLSELGTELSTSFITEKLDDTPVTHRETLGAWACAFIPKLIEEFGLGGLGPSGEDDEWIVEDMAKRTLEELTTLYEVIS